VALTNIIVMSMIT